MRARKGWQIAGYDDGGGLGWLERQIGIVWLTVGGPPPDGVSREVSNVPRSYAGPWYAMVQLRGDGGPCVLDDGPSGYTSFATEGEAMEAAEDYARQIALEILDGLTPKKRKAA